MPRGKRKVEEVPVTETPREKTISVEVEVPVEPPPVLDILKDDKPYAKVMIVYKDNRGREKVTTYVMCNLSCHEDVNESFTESGRKKTSLHIEIVGDVLEKN